MEMEETESYGVIGECGREKSQNQLDYFVERKYCNKYDVFRDCTLTRRPHTITRIY